MVFNPFFLRKGREDLSASGFCGTVHLDIDRESQLAKVGFWERLASECDETPE